MSLFIAGYSIIIINFHSAVFGSKYLRKREKPSAAADDLHPLLGFAVLCRHDGIELLHGVLHRVIDNEIVVGMGGLEFHLGPQQAALDDLLTVGATGGEPPLQLHP